MFFRFLIRDKYLRIRHRYAWDLNSLPLFSHPLTFHSFIYLFHTQYNGRKILLSLLATCVLCCAETTDAQDIFVTSIADGKGRCNHRETSSAFLTTDIPGCGGTNIIPGRRKEQTPYRAELQYCTVGGINPWRHPTVLVFTNRLDSVAHTVLYPARARRMSTTCSML